MFCIYIPADKSKKMQIMPLGEDEYFDEKAEETLSEGVEYPFRLVETLAERENLLFGEERMLCRDEDITKRGGDVPSEYGETNERASIISFGRKYRDGIFGPALIALHLDDDKSHTILRGYDYIDALVALRRLTAALNAIPDIIEVSAS